MKLELISDERYAVGLYAVAARDISDFIDMIQEEGTSTGALRILHEMLTYQDPSVKVEEDMGQCPDRETVRNRELNEICAPIVEQELKRRMGS
jgi:hypothetical protein